MENPLLLRKKIIEETKQKVAEAYSRKDLHIIKAVMLLDDLDKQFNLLAEQAREWYGMHFPELNRAVQDNETFLKLISIGERKEFNASKILKYFKNKEKAKELEERAKKSMGAGIEKEDLKQIQLLAETALGLKKLREIFSSYIEKSMKSLLPNFSELASPLIAARLLAKAGSTKRLAFMPSSTMQIIGAEKALFKHLRAKAKPPKHGLIFSHSLLRDMPKKQRGKIARSLAGKLSIAARTDYFGKKKIAPELKKELDERAAELKGELKSAK